MNSGRVAAVTLGLTFAGAACGMASTMTALSVVYMSDQWLRGFLGFQSIAVLGLGGALLGAALAPSTAWLLLRRVPLGRAFLGLGVGAVLGGLAGWQMPPTVHPLLQPPLGATIGFALAAVLLRLRHARLARVPAASIDALISGWRRSPSTARS